MNPHKHKYSRIRVLFFFFLIVVVHAVATITLTDYYMQKAAETILDVITKESESGQKIENAIEAAKYKTLADTQYVAMGLTFLYLPMSPFWQILSSVSLNKRQENLGPILQKRRYNPKNVLLKCTIINSISFSLCVWVCWRLFLIIRFRKRQKSAQQPAGRDCQ